MQFLPTQAYYHDFTHIIRDLVYDHAAGGGELSANTQAAAEERAAAACNRHSEAERRRRKRINGHLATLRTLLPNTVKTDKASLLAEVVRRVKELKKMSAEIESKEMNMIMIPSESDELEVTYVGEDAKMSMIKAEMCCEDRPELIAEVRRALGLVRGGKLVRTEMGTLGGRMKCVLWVQIWAPARDQGLMELRRALKVVMDRAAFLDLPPNKRPRLSI